MSIRSQAFQTCLQHALFPTRVTNIEAAIKIFTFFKLRDKTNSNFSPSSGFEVFLYLLSFVNIECYEIEPGKL